MNAIRRRGPVRGGATVGQRGFTLVELMVASLLVIVVIFGLAQTYVRGRRHLDYEEDRRKATAVAQDRLDSLRRSFRYDDLGGLDDTDTTYTVDGRDFVVSLAVVPATPEPNSTAITLSVGWTARTPGGTVDRTLEHTTMLGRSLP